MVCVWGGGLSADGSGGLRVPVCSVCVRKRPLSRREKTRKEVDVLKPVSRQTILVYEPKYVSVWGRGGRARLAADLWCPCGPLLLPSG